MAANKERAEREAKKLADEQAAKLAAALRKPPTTTQGSQTETGDAAAIRETNNMILEDLFTERYTHACYRKNAGKERASRMEYCSYRWINFYQLILVLLSSL